MGNQQAGVCAGCAPAGMGSHSLDHTKAIMPTEEELVSYLQNVKSYVVGSLESEDARFKRYMDAFEPKTANLRVCADAFKQELEIGLQCHAEHPFTHVPDECSFKMIDSFVPRAPTGKESGVFYALDFGGSNFRVVRCDLRQGTIKTTHKKASLADSRLPYPKGMLDAKATATQMFDFFANVVAEFMEESGDARSTTTIPLGFTFSYPCVSKSVVNSSLIVWTKGFETGRATDDPVEGADGSELMNQALQRRGLPVRVNCVANDTVGTLLSCAYNMTGDVPPCYIGLILGTGMNACYIDPDSKRFNYTSNIINIECGNFNVRSLPRTNVDHELDFDDVGGRGRQHLEKMCSGAYLGELCRRILVKIFQSNAPAMMWQVDSLSSGDASSIIQDKSETLVVVQKKVLECWNTRFTPEHLRWVKDVCEVVFRRASSMAAVIIAGCAMRTGRLQEAMGGLTCGIDGSLYKMNQFFREDVRKYLVEILGAKQAALINLAFADDGSGLGAAVLSAVLENDRTGPMLEGDRSVDPPRPAQKGPSLEVTVVSVSGLPKKSGLLDKTDPYIEVQLGATTARTATQNNAGESATFNQILTLPYNNDANMIVYAKDDDGKLNKDDFLGSAQLTLPALLEPGQWSGTVPLQPFKGLESKMNNPAVTLRMRVMY